MGGPKGCSRCQGPSGRKPEASSRCLGLQKKISHCGVGFIGETYTNPVYPPAIGMVAMALTKIRVSPRARAIFARYQESTNENERAALACELHGCVGLFPWSDMSVGQVIAEFEHESEQHRGIRRRNNAGSR
jgi:hypothetical protein